MHLDQGRLRDALQLFQEALRLCDDTRTTARHLALLCLAQAAIVLDDHDAPNIVQDALSQMRDANLWIWIWNAVESLAIRWVRSGLLESGSVILGHLEANGHAHVYYSGSRAEALDILRAHPEMSDAQARGAAMTRDQLVTYILGQLDDGTARPEP